MDCSMLGFFVLHHLSKLIQTHVHWVGDAIQGSYPWPFLCSSVNSCYRFLIFSDSVSSISFLSLLCPFCMKCFLGSLNFLKRFLIFPVLLFSFISLHWSIRKTSYFSLLFFGTLHSDGYILLSLLCFPLLLSALCKAFLDNWCCLFSFLFLGKGFDHRLLYNVTSLCP